MMCAVKLGRAEKRTSPDDASAGVRQCLFEFGDALYALHQKLVLTCVCPECVRYSSYYNLTFGSSVALPAAR